MVSSILTNRGAMQALQSLQSTQKNLTETQNRISTGLKVSSAKDNAATWAIATRMRSDISNFSQISENLSVSDSIISTARSAAESITKLVDEIKAKVTSSQNPAIDKAQVQADIEQLIGQVNGIVESAAFKGVNLINSDGNQKVLASVNDIAGMSSPTYIDVANQDLRSAAGSKLDALRDLTVLSRGDQVLQNANDGAEKLTLTLAGGVVDLKAGNEVKVAYIDAAGENRTVTVKAAATVDTTEELIDLLNNDAVFASMFKAEEVDGSTTDITLSARSRDVVARLGKDNGDGSVVTTNLLDANKGTAATLAANALGTATSQVSAGVRSLEMSFKDAALKLGDEFMVRVQTVPGDEESIETYTLRVVNNGETTGDLISDADPSDKNYVLAVAFSEVSGAGVTGKDITTVLKKALVGGTKVGGDLENLRFADTANATGGYTTPFGATSAPSFGVDVDASTGMLTVDTADATYDVLSFNSAATDFDSVLARADKALSAATNAAAAFGSAQKRIGLQKEFMDKLVDTLEAGVGSLVDADMSEEAARLQALQVQEQLGTQALSIANQAPQSILALFR